jgi:hypothetical protein
MENLNALREFKPLRRKSFYGKCSLIRNENKLLLKSYDTIVAEYDATTQQIKINGRYSKTTAEHINSFLHYMYQNQLTKKEMDAQPVIQL